MATSRNSIVILINALGRDHQPGQEPCLNERGFVGLLGLVLAAMIAIFLLFLALNSYDTTSLPAPTLTNQSGTPGVPSSGGGYISVLQSTNRQLKAIEKQQQESADQILRDMQGMSSP